MSSLAIDSRLSQWILVHGQETIQPPHILVPNSESSMSKVAFKMKVLEMGTKQFLFDEGIIS